MNNLLYLNHLSFPLCIELRPQRYCNHVHTVLLSQNDLLMLWYSHGTPCILKNVRKLNTSHTHTHKSTPASHINWMSELLYVTNDEYLFQNAVLSTWHVTAILNSLGLYMLFIIPFFTAKYCTLLVCCYKRLDCIVSQWQFLQVNDATVYGNSYWSIAILNLSALRNWPRIFQLLSNSWYISRCGQHTSTFCV
jgi:hypothetical protein